MRQYLLGGRPLHFPFLSGVMRYDCPTCDAPCCKGASIGVGVSRELITLGHAQPRASLFAVPSFFHSPMLAIQTPAERCWFLDRKNRCRLERVLGRESKPSGCRLFPFVRFRSMGEAVAVLPDFTCPIQIGDAATDHGATSHDEIALEVHRAHVPRSGHPDLVPPRDLTWSDAVLLERRVVEESEPFLRATTYVPFAELQYQLALAFLGLEQKPGSSMARVDETVRRFLDVSEMPSHATVRDLVGLTGTLRLQASALPRREIPAVLTALAVFGAVAESMKGSIRSARTLTSIFEAQLPLLYTLAHLNARPAVRPGVNLAGAVKSAGAHAQRPAVLAVFADVEKNSRRAVAETLEDLLRKQKEAFAPPLSADAVAMLHALGTVLLRACSFVPV